MNWGAASVAVGLIAMALDSPPLVALVIAVIFIVIWRTS